MSIYIDGIKIDSFKFSGGEMQVKTNTNIYANYKLPVNVFASLNSSDEIMELMLTINMIRIYSHQAIIFLTIPYFPYARQDRQCAPREAFSLKVMADMINSLKCERVYINDPHSDVTPALINNCIVTDFFMLDGFKKVTEVIDDKELSIVYPDAGAQKKIDKMLRIIPLFNKTNVINAVKTRDTKNGYITDTRVYGDIEGKSMIILDDICDGGRTFLNLAETLIGKGAHDLYLYVTHGIFSKGYEQLRGYFKHIYCYHLAGQYIDINKENADEEFITILGDDYED